LFALKGSLFQRIVDRKSFLSRRKMNKPASYMTGYITQYVIVVIILNSF